MAITPSIAILFLIIVVCSLEVASAQTTDAVVHEGQCPSRNSLFGFRCRRRVCLPQELVPLCDGDGDCALTQKCCRPMCSCKTLCVEGVHKSV